MKLVRPNIVALTPYSSARTEFDGPGGIFLDANENSLGSPTGTAFNRYPDPLQKEVKRKIAEMEGCSPKNIFVGNGSDEAIDLLIRVFCRPGIDNIIVCPPTYGMYEVSAAINEAEVRFAPLTADFELDPAAIFKKADDRTRLVFLCSPNNPTGNSVDPQAVLRISRELYAVVVIDEAYIHFSSSGTLAGEIASQPNLVILRTFSKAWGLAGLRVGIALADERIVKVINKVKPPYNVSEAAQRELLAAIDNTVEVADMVAAIVKLRDRLAKSLAALNVVVRVYRSDANFLLVKMTDAVGAYRHLAADGIAVRDRSRVELCDGCLRITVGTKEENRRLVGSLERFEGQGSEDEKSAFHRP